MTKKMKCILISSLLLNACLIIGLLSYRSYMKSYVFRNYAMMFLAEADMRENILLDIESDDPEKIIELKEKLRREIETAKHTTLTLRKAIDED